MRRYSSDICYQVIQFLIFHIKRYAPSNFRIKNKLNFHTKLTVDYQIKIKGFIIKGFTLKV